MKRFILRRDISYTETAIVVAESWDDAKSMLENDDTVFTREDNYSWENKKIEFIAVG
jgi:hypothetical protein